MDETDTFSRRDARELQADAFTQEKLERFYRDTFRLLYGCRRWLGIVGDILVWNKPVASAVLYIIVHWLFVIVTRSGGSLLGHLGNLVLLAVLLDVLWRAATKKFDSNRSGWGSTGSQGDQEEEDTVFTMRSSIVRERERQGKPLPFVEVYALSLAPLKEKELPCYDVVCLWLATVAMWVDNLYVAIRHWSIHEPLVFFACLLTPGVFLSLLGKYVPTIVVIYILMMCLLVWPYVEYHDLRVKSAEFLNKNYPRYVDKANKYWLAFKAFIAKDRTDFFEVALGRGGDDQSTAQALEDAFEQATNLRSRQQGEGDIQTLEEDPAEGHPPDASRPSDAQERRNQYGRVHNRNEDPGMSVLQDSVLGLHPQAFQGVEDSMGSLALPAGGFDPLDQSISLPKFPARTRDQSSTPQLSTLSSVPEDDISLPTTSNSYDLDPFADSIELGQDWPDVGRGHSHVSSSSDRPIQRPTNTSTLSTMQGINTSASNATYFPPSGYQAPPSYQAAAEGYDGAIASDKLYFSPDTADDSQTSKHSTVKGGYNLRHRQ